MEVLVCWSLCLSFVTSDVEHSSVPWIGVLPGSLWACWIEDQIVIIDDTFGIIRELNSQLRERLLEEREDFRFGIGVLGDNC